MERKKLGKAGTISSAVKALADVAAAPIEPPAHMRLREGDLPFWRSIIISRPRESWTEHDIEMAVELARCKHDIEKLRSYTCEDLYNLPTISPVNDEIDKLVNRALRLARAIHIHAEATEGSSHWQRQKSQDERAALATVNEIDQFGSLIPTLKRYQ
jgi:hypothetical protein